MPAAARVWDPTGHPGIISGPGIANVLIQGMPAATVGDVHTCALPPLAGPHPPNKIVQGSSNVKIGGRYAARVGDLTGCGAPIKAGASTVIIGG